MPFDEGFIIRHIDKYNKSKKIRTLNILNDSPWDKDLGFGYLMFEDVSNLQNLWKKHITTNKDRQLHKIFLKEFINNTLPIKSWLDKPTIELKQAYIKALEHFEKIANKSSYSHIDSKVVNNYKNILL